MRRNSGHTITLADIRDKTGALQTSADTACKVTVKGASGATLGGPQSMTYLGSAGTWYYDAPATWFPDTDAPWTVIVSVYDNTAATLRGTFTQVGPDQWWTTV